MAWLNSRFVSADSSSKMQENNDTVQTADLDCTLRNKRGITLLFQDICIKPCIYGSSTAAT